VSTHNATASRRAWNTPTSIIVGDPTQSELHKLISSMAPEEYQNLPQELMDWDCAYSDLDIAALRLQGAAARNLERRARYTAEYNALVNAGASVPAVISAMNPLVGYPPIMDEDGEFIDITLSANDIIKKMDKSVVFRRLCNEEMRVKYLLPTWVVSCDIIVNTLNNMVASSRGRSLEPDGIVFTGNDAHLVTHSKILLTLPIVTNRKLFANLVGDSLWNIGSFRLGNLMPPSTHESNMPMKSVLGTRVAISNLTLLMQLIFGEDSTYIGKSLLAIVDSPEVGLYCTREPSYLVYRLEYSLHAFFNYIRGKRLGATRSLIVFKRLGWRSVWDDQIKLLVFTSTSITEYITNLKADFAAATTKKNPLLADSESSATESDTERKSKKAKSITAKKIKTPVASPQTLVTQPKMEISKQLCLGGIAGQVGFAGVKACSLGLKCPRRHDYLTAGDGGKEKTKAYINAFTMSWLTPTLKKGFCDAIDGHK